MTVMLCDLVDSTQLASGLDPEDFKSVMHAYQQACGAVIERYEGHVAQYRGDGIGVLAGPRRRRCGGTACARVRDRRGGKAVEAPNPGGRRTSTGIVVIGEPGFGGLSSWAAKTRRIAARLGPRRLTPW
jgi:class 3 adenylate cyclase